MYSIQRSSGAQMSALLALECALISVKHLARAPINEGRGAMPRSAVLAGLMPALAVAALGASGAMSANVASDNASGAAPGASAAVRAEAREIFAHIVGIESSVGKGQVSAVAEYLASRFKACGFPAADIHVLPLGETASLVVRYRGNGSGGRPIDFLAHMDVVK